MALSLLAQAVTTTSAEPAGTFNPLVVGITAFVVFLALLFAVTRLNKDR